MKSAVEMRELTEKNIQECTERAEHRIPQYRDKVMETIHYSAMQRQFCCVVKMTPEISEDEEIFPYIIFGLKKQLKDLGYRVTRGMYPEHLKIDWEV